MLDAISQSGAPPRSFPVPAEAVGTQSSMFSFPLPYAENQEVVFMLADATSLNAGGPTRPFIVGNRRKGAASTCSTAPLGTHHNPIPGVFCAVRTDKRRIISCA